RLMSHATATKRDQPLQAIERISVRCPKTADCERKPLFGKVPQSFGGFYIFPRLRKNILHCGVWNGKIHNKTELHQQIACGRRMMQYLAKDSLVESPEQILRRLGRHGTKCGFVQNIYTTRKILGCRLLPPIPR